MMTESLKTDRSLDQLGLPPMELAETANERNSRCLYRCIYPALQKVFILLVLITFSAGLYILLLKLLDSNENYHNTEIVLVTGQDTRNITVRQNDWDIFFLLKNDSNTNIKRRKRNILNSRDKNKEILERLRGDDLEKVREVMLNYRALCHDETHKDTCAELIVKLRAIIRRSEPIGLKIKDTPQVVDTKKETLVDQIEPLPTEVTKRETHSLNRIRNVLSPTSNVPLKSHLQHSHPHLETTQHLTDTCLLAKLLKQSYPHVHEIYDPPSSNMGSPHFEQSHLPHMRYFQPSMQNNEHSREVETQRQKLHPQDFDIFMNFFHKPEVLPKQETQKSSRTMECPSESLPCDNNEDCIGGKQWCDGNVDCSDASDEIRCSCKSRVDETRLCDGYFDCPFGEDEMGCFGCREKTFSCDNVDMNSQQGICFTKEQRCNGVNDCPNHKDEIECNMLAPSLHKKPLFAISNTEGYLHRNFRGDWYAVCQNPYMWAHDACRRETGLMIRPPMIQIVPIDPTAKVNYLNNGPGNLMQTSDTCFNSSAVYITCPDFLCGTRVQTTSQLLRENIATENHLFGRNKRFLYPGFAFDPHHMMYYKIRVKRDITASNTEETIRNSGMDSNKPNYERNKRTESRVVGGKASQPAAWPWMVAIYRNGMFHCGGVILNQNWIISAAHCVHMFWDYYYEIQVGMLRRFSFSPQEQNHRVTHVILNQHYNQIDMRDDLSLLKVEPAIQFSRWVRPICLPGPNTAGPDWMWGPSEGTMCTAVGWGATVEHGADPDHMREVEVPIWEHCKHREDRAGKEICAGLTEGGKDACQGDSGGPLLCRNPLNSQQWYLAGIVSHGDGCARKEEPGVYTRVSLFVKWIKYHTSSKLLPLVQPLQECPGFKCFSGISKCLPNIRKCDKIVDCLDAEDEINCSFMTSKTVNTTNNEEKINKMSRKVESTLLYSTDKTHLTDEIITFKSTTDITMPTTEQNAMTDFEKKLTNSNESDDVVTLMSTTDITVPTTEKAPMMDFVKNVENRNENNKVIAVKSNTEMTASTEIIATTKFENTFENANLSDSKPSESAKSMVPVNTIPDFERASTIEFSPTESIEELSTDDSNNITPDPTEITSEENIETTSQSDLQTITVSIKPGVLESRSFVRERTQPDNKFTRDIDTDEDLIKESTLPSILISQENDEHFISSTQKSRGDGIPDADKDIDNNLLDNSVTASDNKAQFSNIENKSDVNLIKDLLPQSNSSLLIETSKDDVVTDSHDSKSPEININTQSLSAKNLPDIEGKSDVIQKIEEIVFSELQPASIRRKHRVPKGFVCRSIYQQIPFSRRCDHQADCEDGTDELDCTCTDYLSSFDHKLICDGVFDCSDGQDEIDCYSCLEDHFLCKRSEICLPTKYVCDGLPQCPFGEDELNCFALSNGREMVYEIDEKPKINLEGFLTKRNKDDWQVVCEDQFSIEQQEESATHICHYLGFGSANRYFVKYINVKDEDIVRSGMDEIRKTKREIGKGIPIHFAFRDVAINNETARNIIIKEPQVLKEECVPNVTRTCKSLYVFCDRSLYTNFEVSQDLLYNRAVETDKAVITTHMWPWIAKVYVEGDYKCTGVLIDTMWVLVSDSCLWDSSPSRNFVSVILGSHRTLSSVNGLYEQVHKVKAMKDLYANRVVLLHLKEPAKYSNMVKPMIVPASNFHKDEEMVCVAVGQDNNNNTISLFLNETNEHCNLSNRCFVRRGKEGICPTGMETNRRWSGIISCHNEQGWYPAASFVDSRGECGLGDRIIATDIEYLRKEIKYYSEKVLIPESFEQTDNGVCKGVRCSRGKCVPLLQMCDGVKNCEDGNDESEDSCRIKHQFCEKDPYQNGCDCSLGQMKCKNGKCISKELFRDGNDDCGDGTDEPMRTSCFDYLARVMPSRLCDGVLHCHDRSDEDPMYCKCFAKETYKCGKSSEVSHCVAPDMVCDGIRDCPNGDDERTCIALSAPDGTPYGTGQVIVRSHGVWHSKCYPTQTHTKSELEAICRELGFISGHAKEIKDKKYLVNSHNNLLLEPFSDVVLNNQTVLKMRNTNDPIARPVFDSDLKNCFPVFIECL